MKILVTGATGFIGKNLVQRLVEDGNIVHVLYRDEKKLSSLHHKNIKAFKGDINDISSLETATEDCCYVYHLAAFAGVWSKNKDDFFNINFTGTINVLETALKYGVKKIVLTSTAGVFGPSIGMSAVDENTVRKTDYFNEYERTKDYTDAYVFANYSSKINLCIVCPTRVFGPGKLSESNSVTKMIKMYVDGKWKYLPGDGKSIGNYVFIDDVINGMLLAMQKGKTGERYILGGENLNFIEFFEEIARQVGNKHHMFKIPVWLMLAISQLMIFAARTFGIKPLITSGWAKKYLHHWIMSSDKAKTNLGYQPASFQNGLEKTIIWLRKN